MGLSTDFNANFNQFIDGLSTFLIGIVVVFVTLILLIVFITLMSKIVAAIENKKQEQKLEVQPVEANVQSMVKEPNDELEIIAVITAVLAASMGTTADKLQVKSFRKVERRAR